MIDSYVALDIETTGLNPAADRIIEIGMARVCNGNVAPFCFGQFLIWEVLQMTVIRTP